MRYPLRILETTLNLIPAGIAAWSVLGAAGTALAYKTGSRSKARRFARTIVTVWVVYAAILLLTSRLQPQRVLAPGKAECFGNLCYAIASVRTVGEFKGEGGGQLVQVAVRVSNKGTETDSTPGLEAYLVDASGHPWFETVGLGGVPLTEHLPGASGITSQPVFRVQGTPPGLGLVLTRRWHGFHWLVLGDTDSPFHRRTVLMLP